MEKFFEDLKLDAQTYAIIHYFKLLKQIDLVEKEGYPIFQLIGGEESLKKLEIAAEEGAFDCRLTNMELFLILKNNIEQLNTITHPKTLFVEEAIRNTTIIESHFPKLNKEPALETLTRKLQEYPASLVIPFLASLKESREEQEKTKQIKKLR